MFQTPDDLALAQALERALERAAMRQGIFGGGKAPQRQ
jgi:hypothetical protein